MRWSEMQSRQPRLADRVRQRVVAPGVTLVVTLRNDGTPRLSPVEPLLHDGGLWLSMMSGSLKARDLVCDPRLLVHGVVTARDGRDGEVKLRGQARAESDTAKLESYAAAAAATLGWSPEVGRFHLFEVDIKHVASVRYAEHGDQYLTTWPPGREVVRRPRPVSGHRSHPVCQP